MHTATRLALPVIDRVRSSILTRGWSPTASMRR